MTERSNLSSYERGEFDGLKGEPAPPHIHPGMPWWQRLYIHGWEAGVAKRAELMASAKTVH